MINDEIVQRMSKSCDISNDEIIRMKNQLQSGITLHYSKKVSNFMFYTVISDAIFK